MSFSLLQSHKILNSVESSLASRNKENILFFMATPLAYGSSRARDWIRATTAVTILDPLTHCTWQGIKPVPLRWPVCYLRLFCTHCIAFFGLSFLIMQEMSSCSIFFLVKYFHSLLWYSITIFFVVTMGILFNILKLQHSNLNLYQFNFNNNR